jgi:hypothetical protein
MRKIGRDFEDGARQMADRLEALARKSLLADPFDEKADGEEAVLVEPGQPVSVVATIVVDDPTSGIDPAERSTGSNGNA